MLKFNFYPYIFDSTFDSLVLAYDMIFGMNIFGVWKANKAKKVKKEKKATTKSEGNNVYQTVKIHRSLFIFNLYTVWSQHIWLMQRVFDNRDGFR